MPVADWTIQRQAFFGPLRGGGGRSLVLSSSRYPGAMLSGSKGSSKVAREPNDTAFANRRDPATG
jgi:hypothetical protein